MQATRRHAPLLGLATLAALGLAAAHPAQAQTNLITNGSFEDGDFTGFATSNLGDSKVEQRGGDWYSPEDGIYFAVLDNADSDATIQQTIDTVIGDSYTFSYYLASNGYTPNDFSAYFGSTEIFTGKDILGPGYALYSYNEIATSTSTTISFDDTGLALDNISVVDNGPAAPEPSSIAAFAFTALGAATLILRARTRRTA